MFMVDCGEGTQHQIVKSDIVKPSRVEAIFITHLHGDHCFGLPGLLASFSLLGQRDTLLLVGPQGIRQMVETNISLSSTYLTYSLSIVELVEGEINDLGLVNGIEVSAYPLTHKVACFGFLFKEPDTIALDGKRAAQLGAKGPQMKLLKEGKDVVLDNGNIILASDVLLPSVPGKKVVALGDTSDSSSILENGTGCSVIVHESTYDDSLRQKAIDGGHSTAKMAGEFANQIQAKKLILTHFSKRYFEGELAEEKNVNDLRNEAALECPSTEVIIAEDFSVVEI